MKRVRAALWIVAGIVVVLALIAGGVVLWSTYTKTPLPLEDRCMATAGGRTTIIDPEQARNAAIIAGMSIKRGLAPRAASIALATAYQESGLRNLDYGHSDSIGLFQQRPSKGWGTVEEIMNPWYSTREFYRAMEDVYKRQTFSYPGDPSDPHQDVVGASVIPLFDDPVAVILRNDHPLSGQGIVSLEQLAGDPWIAGCQLCRGHLLAACGALGVTPRIAHATDNSVAVLSLVAAGVGVALQPGLALEPLELPSGTGAHAVRPSSDRRVRAVHTRGAEAVPTVAGVLSTLLAVTANRRVQPSQRRSASWQL